MSFINRYAGVLVLSFLLFVISCEEETPEAEPESATISGTVTFLGTWPDPGTIFISLQSDWPPTGAPYAVQVISETGNVRLRV